MPPRFPFVTAFNVSIVLAGLIPSLTAAEKGYETEASIAELASTLAG